MSGRAHSGQFSCTASVHRTRTSAQRLSRRDLTAAADRKGFQTAQKTSQKKKQAKASTAERKQKEMLAAITGETLAPTKNPELDQPEDVMVIRKGKGTTKKEKKKVVSGSLYENPMIYDWAGSYRDYEAEVDFLFDVYEEVLGEEPLSFLEVGCGPAQHSMEMAESQLKVFCVDNQPEMLQYAASLAAEDEIELTQIDADMRTFALPDGAQVDMAAILVGTLQHMLTQDDVIETFKRVHEALVPGGIFVVELNHPELLFNGSVATSADAWTIEIDDAQLQVWWGHEGDKFDPFTQVLHKTVEIEIMKRNGEWRVLNDTLHLRQFTFQEVLLLSQTSGFEVVRTYGDFCLKSRILDTHGRGSEKEIDQNDEEPFRMILILQKPLE